MNSCGNTVRTPFEDVGFVQGMKLPTIDEIKAAIASLNFVGFEGQEFKKGMQEALVARSSANIY